MTKSLLLIDALNLIRRIFAVERNHATDDIAVRNTSQRVVNACLKLIKTTSATHVAVVFDGQKSWRYQYYEGYKQSRSPMPEALSLNLKNIANELSNKGICIYFPDNDEADDVIATLATKAAQHGINSTIVSTDKGFLPLMSGKISVYDYFSKCYLDAKYVENKFGVLTDNLTEYWALCGDKTNDIPGVSGIGKKSAQTILNQHRSLKDALTSDALNKNIISKLQHGLNDYILSKNLVSLRTDILLGFTLKDLRYYVLK